MSKNVLIISTSLRNGSNSELLALECEKGAKQAGHDVTYISLKDKEIHFCIGCLACQQVKKCVFNDDITSIMEKVKEAEVIIFATPIYYYGMSGMMKTMLDRLNPLYGSDYAFRDIYMIATAAEDGQTVFEKAYTGLQGWVDCFSKASLKGIVTGGGIGEANTATKHIDVMKSAYELGKNL
ncbi:MAG: flavodoxin family protein [Bacillota bacterium]|nr:flavodoxin family protein [Bacillota bacterium]